ncbi:DUF892 family protein|uniref:DUF892 family protein n=1 Tax=Rhizobium altiplani TaxID=1864509 RepID=UPI0009E9CD19
MNPSQPSPTSTLEHYEIARCGTQISWAGQLALEDAVPLLQANIEEEMATDEKLTQLAEAQANAKGEAKAAKRV